MTRLVQKFGGTSVADAKRIHHVAKIIAETKRQGKDVVVVASAMGQTTDELIALAAGVTDEPDTRELDVLLSTGEVVSVSLLTMALQKLGVKARSFTGPQAGILTDEAHTLARIKTVHPTRLEATLARGEVAVVAGFQGMTRTSEITTLGRGGSDTTAVALAAALKAECCDIYTDVNGVYTTDPRIWQGARRLPAISYEEMLELASMGAQVLNARSVELAAKNSVPIRLRSTFEPEDPGTLVATGALAPASTVCGVALDNDRILIQVELLEPADAERYERLFAELACEGLQRQDFSLSKNENELLVNCPTRLSKTVPAAIKDFFAGKVNLLVNKDVSRVSVVGQGLDSLQAGKDLAANLGTAGIPVLQVTARSISASAITTREFGAEAVRQLHESLCSPIGKATAEHRRQTAMSLLSTLAASTSELYAFQGEIDWQENQLVAEPANPWGGSR